MDILDRINDALTVLAADCGINTATDEADEMLDDLTHHVARVFRVNPTGRLGRVYTGDLPERVTGPTGALPGNPEEGTPAT